MFLRPSVTDTTGLQSLFQYLTTTITNRNIPNVEFQFSKLHIKQICSYPLVNTMPFSSIFKMSEYCSLFFINQISSFSSNPSDCPYESFLLNLWMTFSEWSYVLLFQADHSPSSRRLLHYSVTWAKYLPCCQCNPPSTPSDFLRSNFTLLTSTYFEVCCNFRIIFCPTAFSATYCFAFMFAEVHLVDFGTCMQYVKIILYILFCTSSKRPAIVSSMEASTKSYKSVINHAGWAQFLDAG